MADVRFSVVVPTYDRPDMLAKCLESLARQDADDYEVIVVDDGSGPETAEVIRKAVAAYPHRLRSIRMEKNSGCAKARNRGVAEARGAIILFIDDDCEAPRGWIRAHADAHARYPDAVGVGGWNWPAHASATNPYERLFKLQFEALFPAMRDCEVWTNTMRSPAGNTANMSYKRQFLDEVSGFDETLYFTGGVDWELKARAIALQRSLVYIPLAVTHHKHYTLRSFIFRTIRQGRGMDYHARKFIGLTKPDLHTALGIYASWVSSPVTRSEPTGTLVLWLACLIVGKWVNRLTGFGPNTTYELRNPSYFTRRFVGGHEVTVHQLVPFPPEEASTPSDELPFCSVIIPTFNRASMVVQAIRAVVEQDYPHDRYEIIVADDGSTDGTAEAIEALSEEYPGRTITYVHQENRGAALARNRGAAEARGDILFFTDSDCRVPKQWLRTHVRAYREHSDIVGAGGGILSGGRAGILSRYRNTFQDNYFVARYRDTLVKTNDTTTAITPYDSANMSVRADVFKKVGGFYPVGMRGIAAYHEDVDFAYRVQRTGGCMALVPRVPVTNMRTLGLRAFWQTALVRGAALPALIERIAPAGLDVCATPSRRLIAARFTQCVLRPLRLTSWVNVLHLVGYYVGYQRAISALQTGRATYQ